MQKQILSRITDTFKQYNYTANDFERQILDTASSKKVIVHFEDYLSIDDSLLNKVTYIYKRERRLYFTFIEHVTHFDRFRFEYTNYNKLFTKWDQEKKYSKIDEVLEVLRNWFGNIDEFEQESSAYDEWDDHLFTPPKELTSGIETIDFDSQELFSEEEQRLIEADLDKTQEFIQNEVGLDEDRLTVIERDISEIKQELTKRSKFSWKEFAREKLIDELINAAKDRLSLMQLYKLFEFLGPFDLPQLGN